MTMNSPCLKCDENKRHIGCHSSCNDYIQAKKDYEEKKLKMRLEKEKVLDYKNFKNSVIKGKKGEM